MAIQMISKTVDHPEKATGTIDTYITVPGQLTRWKDVGNQLLDGMLQAQENVGQIHWVDLSMTIAQGIRHNLQYGGNDRVIVIDADNADANDVIDALLWVNGASTGHVS